MGHLDSLEDCAFNPSNSFLTSRSLDHAFFNPLTTRSLIFELKELGRVTSLFRAEIRSTRVAQLEGAREEDPGP